MPARSHKDGSMARLSDSQKKVERIINEGISVFIFGKGGSGKSFSLWHFIEQFKSRGSCYFVTALTGIAGVNVEGSTIHSFAEIGTVTMSTNELIARIKSDKEVCQRWKNCSV